MTAPNPDDRLQQYFDGELSASDSDVFRRELETDGELRAKLAGLEHLSAMMKAGAEELAGDLDGDALFAGIEARLAAGVEDDDPMFPEAEADEPAVVQARPALRVVAGGKTDAAKTATSAAPARTGLWVGVVATLAAAAAILFFVLREDPTRPEVPGEDPVVAANEPPHGSEVLDVDFGYSTGAIFSVEGQEGAQYAVVWISDEKVEEDSPEERVQ